MRNKKRNRVIVVTPSFRLVRNRFGWIGFEKFDGVDNMGAKRWIDLDKSDADQMRIWVDLAIEVADAIEKRAKARRKRVQS
jgi:hypothetical protein